MKGFMTSKTDETTEFILSVSEQLELDEKISQFQEIVAVPAFEPEWATLYFHVPNSFLGIFHSTIQGYKDLLGTDKAFPALEALTLEARNSLPNEILQRTEH